MLTTLYIQNYALIEQLDINFQGGFSVITGETGAGKSILLGAIGLLLGQRADVKAIRRGASKCIIEAHFAVGTYGMKPFFEEHGLEYDEECILRRELYASGKSRGFINDTPTPLSLMKELGEQLIDIHSQHQNLLLDKEGFQLNVLDLLGHNDRALEEYTLRYNRWRKLRAELDELQAALQRDRTEEDYLRFQWEQLSEAHLTDGEQEALEQEAEMLSHAEEIKAGLYKSVQLLEGDDGGVMAQLKEVMHTLSSLAGVFAPAEELASRMESSYIELKDIAQEASAQEEQVEYNPERMDEVNDRLNLIYTLQKKHRVESVAALIELMEGFERKLSQLSQGDDRIEALTAEVEQGRILVIEQAERLSEVRRQAASQVEQEIVNRLALLGMPNVRFAVEIGRRKEPGSHGMDTVNFLFSANKNAHLQSISSVASGGETARVMLSLKAMIAGAVKLPTIVFDEIDTGVSGEIADRMADIMQEMGDNDRQVISITHLPQIAARGAVHYKVYKEDNDTETNSHIRCLTPEERIEEIAHMLSGATLTEAALANAKALLHREG
ncbi:MAG: DNA repair protein RecN [Bacteroides sp.]